MAWWWGAVVGVEMAWVFGAWLLLAGSRAGSGTRERLRAIFVPAYFLYHLPLLLLHFLSGGWAGRLLEAKGWWLLVEAVIIGGITVLIYGSALSFFFPAAG